MNSRREMICSNGAGQKQKSREGVRRVQEKLQERLQERLSRIRAVKMEIKDLQNRIDNLPVTKDSVRGSMVEFPYIERTITITGIDVSSAARLRRKLERKCAELQDEISELEDIMEDVSDPEMRLILRLHYVDGLSQDQVAEEMGYATRTIQRKMAKFFQDVV